MKTFMRHSGNQLRKWIGLDHEKVNFDKEYTYAEFGGKVVFRSEPDEDHDVMVIRPNDDITVHRRMMVTVNPRLGAFAPYNCEMICEPGEVPTVYMHGFDGFLEDLDLPWIFRCYFVR